MAPITPTLTLSRAALETIRIFKAGGISRLAALRERLRAGLARAILDAGVVANVTGYGSGFMINWREQAPVTFKQAADADFDRAERFRVLMLQRGILLPPFVITDSRLCLATSEDDIDETVVAAEAVLKSLS